MFAIVQATAGLAELAPVHHKIFVCKGCGVTTDVCNKTGSDGGLEPREFECRLCYKVEYVLLQFHMHELAVLIRHMCLDIDVCVALLDHLREDLVKNSSLQSDRYNHYRTKMDEQVVDARHVFLITLLAFVVSFRC